MTVFVTAQPQFHFWTQRFQSKMENTALTCTGNPLIDASIFSHPAVTPPMLVRTFHLTSATDCYESVQTGKPSKKD